MVRNIFMLFFLMSCNQINNKGETASFHIKIDSLPTNTSPKPKNVIRFNNQLPFEITSIRRSLANSTDEDTTKCADWILTQQQVERIIKNAQPIGGTEWDLTFSVLSCKKDVILLQEGRQYELGINAGSYFWISGGDTTELFGDYDKRDKKLFLAEPYVE